MTPLRASQVETLRGRIDRALCCERGSPRRVDMGTSGPAFAPDEASPCGVETVSRDRRVESPQPGNNWGPRPAVSDPRSEHSAPSLTQLGKEALEAEG